MEKSNYKLAIKLALINLRYDMHKNTIHKMNFAIICAEFIMFIVGMILQITMKEFREGIAIMNAIWTLVVTVLVVINTEILSSKAMKVAKEQGDFIETLLDELSKDGSEDYENHE